MFGTALLVALVPTRLLDWSVATYPTFASLVVRHFPWALIALLLFQLAALFRLFTRELPAWMDNAYRHENQADNLLSLRRAGTGAARGA